MRSGPVLLFVMRQQPACQPVSDSQRSEISVRQSVRSFTSRSRSQEATRVERREEAGGVEADVDWTSLDVTAGSSLYISPVGTVNMSGDTSYEDRTLSDIHCPPPLPILDKTGSEL